MRRKFRAMYDVSLGHVDPEKFARFFERGGTFIEELHLAASTYELARPIMNHMNGNPERPERYVMMPKGEERYREFYEQVAGYHGLFWGRSLGYEYEGKVMKAPEGGYLLNGGG